MAYYGARNGKIDLSELKITQRKFKDFFLETYFYFYNQGYFKLAFEGHHSTPRLMKPSPEAYIFLQVGNKDIFPIGENVHKFDKVTIFTLIEILHKYIRKIDDFGMYDYAEAQMEFRTEINKFLPLLDEGYLLSDNGYIINLPDDGLGNLITSDLPERTSDTVTEQVETAIKMFLKYDSNMEEKKKAINILADILEPYREKLKSYSTTKHDTMIFGIVNQYGIRHNDINQKEEYDKPIWYQWMFHYYLATVHAALELTEEHFK